MSILKITRAARRVSPTLAVVAVALLAGLPAHAESSPSPPALSAVALVTQMSQRMNGLNSYTARVHFDTDVHAFVDLHPALDASYYFKRPDKVELVFDSLPALGRQFQHLYASQGTPETWPQSYDISYATPAENDTSFFLTLVPKKQGNVDRIIVTVDRQTLSAVATQWRYRNGGLIMMSQQSRRVGGFVLPQTQTADFSLPSYKAHVVSTYSDYRINAAVPDSVFTDGG
jgi:hypothetical protein